ncbi:uncharacterized protein LOC127254047 isoform X2 [Andrographis paniculata]|uniref:uncharacterized protein LOC127254047 isoform X2 n=1 Tax=Andrographis paniculata TaxID=175694 RepID=UPI0021E701AB|nr:uncharacterized protein LOC127254047 isoform X2 [Andrographis paniculata]XP_051134890.1 uncharacterized protein LOC127254047 isoform X2 [Andrographis paniculata]XP_051134895.1 uncharacterized protein LOC127254047 isoform X2 [Andrographis paniculata]
MKPKMPRRSKAKTAASKSVAAPSRSVSSGNASPFFFDLRGADGSLGSSPSPSVNPPASSPTIDASHSRGPPRSLVAAEDETTTNRLIIDLMDSRLRENALAHLARRARGFQDFAVRLWFSFGTIAILLQEVLSVYPFLSPPSLTPIQSDRLCNVLTLIQCVASHQETRSLFVQAYLPFYLVLLLNQIGELRCFERIRILTLGIIAALVQHEAAARSNCFDCNSSLSLPFFFVRGTNLYFLWLRGVYFLSIISFIACIFHILVMEMPVLLFLCSEPQSDFSASRSRTNTSLPMCYAERK